MSMHAEKLHTISDDDRADALPRLARLNDIMILATSGAPWSPAVTAGISLAACWHHWMRSWRLLNFHDRRHVPGLV